MAVLTLLARAVRALSEGEARHWSSAWVQELPDWVCRKTVAELEGKPGVVDVGEEFLEADVFPLPVRYLPCPPVD